MSSTSKIWREKTLQLTEGSEAPRFPSPGPTPVVLDFSSRHAAPGVEAPHGAKVTRAEGPDIFSE